MRSKRIPLSFPKSPPLTFPFPLHATRSTGIPGLTGFHEGGKATKRDGFKGRGHWRKPRSQNWEYGIYAALPRVPKNLLS